MIIVNSELIFRFFSGETELFHLFDNPENLCVSVITYSSLILKCNEFQKNNTNQELNIYDICKSFCTQLTMISVDSDIAEKYAELKLEMEQQYKNFDFDEKLWIQATACVKNLEII